MPITGRAILVGGCFGWWVLESPPSSRRPAREPSSLKSPIMLRAPFRGTNGVRRPGVHKIAAQFGVATGTVQRIAAEPRN
jgi:hypothetical protein